MANVSFFQGNAVFLKNQNYIDGALRLTLDKNELYYDTIDNRYKIVDKDLLCFDREGRMKIDFEEE